MSQQQKSHSPELWERYKHIWKTKPAFFAWLRGALRRALWERYPVKLYYKNKATHNPPIGYTGKAKKLGKCALTGEVIPKSRLEVDHKVGHVSLTEWSDLEPFIHHLLCTEDEMQLVSKEAHKIKSYAERMGISYEEAAIEKEVIAFSKLPIDQQKKELLEHGYTEINNASDRKRSYRRLLGEHCSNRD